MHAAGDVRIEDVPDPVLIEPTDAIVRVTRACICGSDLVVMPFAFSDGSGALGLCGVIAAKRLGAEQIIILGRHEDRIALAREFGATDVVSQRGREAVERVLELTRGAGAHSVLECVGSGQAMATAVAIARPGGAVGRVGVPQEESIPASGPAFFKNVTIRGGPAPVRAYIEALLPDILEGRIEPGNVFGRTVELDGVPDGYRAMADRQSIKVMVRP
jgi:threonine dehydrogenase-like Zn-dependent dehydrogenase